MLTNTNKAYINYFFFLIEQQKLKGINLSFNEGTIRDINYFKIPLYILN